MSQADFIDKNLPGLSCAQHENCGQDVEQSSTPNPPAIKKRLVLVSRRIITVHGPVPAAGPPCFPPNKQPMSLASSPAPCIQMYANDINHVEHSFVFSSHRICLICRLMKPVSEIVIITDENDKLFVVLSAIYRRKMDFTLANHIYKHSPFYACSAHLPEASAGVLRMLGVSSAVGILKARSRKVSQVEAFARHISRNSYINVDKLLSLAYSFTQKHPQPFVS
ncbi:Protein CBG25640 [Caenorhabditis briggsae]|uniref:Protein CBG25640 n=1 Tax=Caenorhabditis briggsae TaxID=6238 RepID=B6IFC4_CAEBR|nr:Protein CBG25640 [Caenorhabditis briggsae]CAR98604.1 Protein CBG25640 [Caenorhabditis briggsae]